jgi:hypothetical protein
MNAVLDVPAGRRRRGAPEIIEHGIVGGTDTRLAEF